MRLPLSKVNPRSRREQRGAIKWCRNSVELRIQEPRDRGMETSESKGLRDTGLAQSVERMFQQSRTEIAVPVFHRDAGTWREVIFASGIERKDGCTDDSRTMTQYQAEMLIGLCATHPRVNHGQRLMQ
jgi:hypothetical protein